MQCTNTSWVSTVHPPLIRTSNSQTMLSISQTHTQFARNPHDNDDVVVTLPLPSHVKSITSPSNPFVKHCLKLRHSSSYRHSHGSALVVGATPIRSLMPFLPLFHLYFIWLLCKCLIMELKFKWVIAMFLFFLCLVV